MRKNEMSCHDHDDIIAFLSDHCTHMRTSEFSFARVNTNEVVESESNKITYIASIKRSKRHVNHKEKERVTVFLYL
jgi:hypothetical protein